MKSVSICLQLFLMITLTSCFNEKESNSEVTKKIWLAAATEPENRDFQAIEKNASKETGSALLIAHNTDVTFGNISIVPLRQRK